VPQESVVEITLDDQNQTLAPINEITPPVREKTLEEFVMENWYMEASAEPGEPNHPLDPGSSAGSSIAGKNKLGAPS